MSNPSVPATIEGSLPASTRSRVVGILTSVMRVRELFMVILILIISIAMAILSPHFLNIANFVAIMRGLSLIHI